MRKETMTVNTYYAARKAAHWAARIAKVCGGYIAFESMADYAAWRKQK